MAIFLNDSSLQEQFDQAHDFLQVLREIMKARARDPWLHRTFSVTRSFSAKLICPGVTVRKAVNDSQDRELIRLVLAWLDRNGPFWEDNRIEENEDYFEYEGDDVTGTGLGEAARACKSTGGGRTFSFNGGKVNYTLAPLTVLHGLPDQRLGSYDVDNVWVVEQLREMVAGKEQPIDSWEALKDRSRAQFPNLILPDTVFSNPLLRSEGFQFCIAKATMSLLQTLDTYAADRTDEGVEGNIAKGLVNNFFRGDRALFTGESATNRDEFEKELSFTDPSDQTKKIFAPWHGKISHRFFRLHFEWPVPAKQKEVKILYLGPKITKR